ncbi:MAG: hypothetical protein AB7I57_05470 [Pirellulales bacterium]
MSTKTSAIAFGSAADVVIVFGGEIGREISQRAIQMLKPVVQRRHRILSGRQGYIHDNANLRAFREYDGRVENDIAVLDVSKTFHSALSAVTAAYVLYASHWNGQAAMAWQAGDGTGFEFALQPLPE